MKIILPERIGYVHSDYMTVSSDGETETDGSRLSFSLAPGRDAPEHGGL